MKWPLSVAPSKIGEKSGVSSPSSSSMSRRDGGGGYSSRYTSRPSDNLVFSRLEFRVTWSKYEDLGDMWNCDLLESVHGIQYDFDAIFVKDECWARDYYLCSIFFFFLEFLDFFFSVEYEIFQFCKFDFL